MVDYLQAKKDFMKNKVQQLLKKLAAKGFSAYYCENEEDACQKALTLISPGLTVGIGGSVTLRQIGLVETLRENNYQLYEHWQKDLAADERHRILHYQARCDVFLSGTNALTMDGDLVNIDRTGNRVAALSFGPKKVIMVAGINKIENNLEQALYRAKNTAAPINCQRLEVDTPCLKHGFCQDCRGNESLCRVINIIQMKPVGIPEFVIILVGKNLGY